MTGRGVILHEWIERRGGAERVVDAMASAFPAADLGCTWDDDPGRYPGRVVRESFIARTPLRGRKALALPALSAMWRAAPPVRGEYDWALVSSHLFAHHARVLGVAPERQFTYVHTPARYLWNPELDARGDRLAVRAVAPFFRAVDRRRGRELRRVAANSGFVRDRIRDAWGIEARVIHPPVQVDRLTSVPDWSAELDEHELAVLEDLPRGYLLGASRFVPYKRLDVAIDAGRASDRPVVIAGSGPGETELRALSSRSGVDVRFVIDPSDALMAALMQRATAFVFPPVEDFGIMPVEAMALGTPVVANRLGGAGETVQDGVTGALVDDFSDAALARAVDRVSGLDGAACRERAAQFRTERFQQELREWMGVS
ncbi:glycosyltransferase [Curtobacterium sp. DN_7.5]|uniref:glycosyltransferase n=1 Tax=Curtobacterium sp. DN_7.5 TaxID=3049047 RepID=UPI001F59F4EC|nr:glycosyltransferase [Curtobacterium sp. DN_7.5]